MLDKKLFAERLKAKRHERQLSQNQLAKIIHVASSAVSNYERGVALPEICIAEKMSRYFGVSLDWLIGAEENFSDKTKNDTESFLSALNSIINISVLGEDGEDIVIFVPKITLLGEYLQNVYFLRSQQQMMSDTLKQHIEEFNQRAYQKYSIEDLLKEKTAQRGNA